MSKLTLSVDKAVVSRARRYAKKQGVSISQMVETYLAAVSEPSGRGSRQTPILRSLQGSLKRAEVQEYRRHLADKYR